MDRFKPLIEYYKIKGNLLYDILYITLFIIILYYSSKNFKKQYNILIDIPSIIIGVLIGRSYKLNIISFNEIIFYIFIIGLLISIIKYNYNSNIL